MNPCSQNRKLIASLALAELEPAKADELRRHFQSCAACRGYYEELLAVTRRLASVEDAPKIAASANFHARLVKKLEAEKAKPIWQTALEQFRFTFRSRQVIWPVLGAAAAAIAVLLLIHKQHMPNPVPSAPMIAATPHPNIDFAPTISNYKLIANRSLDQLDEVLTEQANRHPAPAPIYTAGVSGRPDLTE